MADNPIKFSELFEINSSDAEALLGVATAIKGLNSSYKAFAKNLDGDGQKVSAALGAILPQTAALRQQFADVNLLNDQGKVSLAGLTAEVGKLAAENQRLKQAQAGITASQQATASSTKILTTELRQQQTALKEAFAAGNTAGITAAATEILRLKNQSEDLNRALRGANSIYTASAGSFRAMENEARTLNTQLKNLAGGMESDTAEAQALKARLAEVNGAIITFGRNVNDGHANVGRYAESIIEAVGVLDKQRSALLRNAEALRTQAGATGLSREAQDKLQQEIRQTETELQRVNGELRNYGVVAKQAGGATSAIGAGAEGLVQSLAGAYFGIQGIATVLEQEFEANIKYSDSIADVAKTTGLTTDQTNQLAESLKKLDTRTSLQGLLDIAEVGGQLGVAAGDIESFAKVIDISVQALGNDFKGGAEEIATSLGKINTVFGKQLGADLSENLLHIGSALNQLGAVGAATAPQLADVALRTGAVAANAGLGLDKVLAYAAVLEEVGVSAETSGTGLNRLFNTLSTKTKASFDIAKLGDANLTLKEFRRLVNTDFEGAIQAFLKGLNAGGTTTTRFNQLLGTLKLSSSSAKDVITTLAKNVDTYRERLAVANSELASGNSVAAEAAIKNNTLGGSYEKLKNTISNLFTSSVIGDFIKDTVDEQRQRLELLTTGFHKLGDAIAYVKQKTGLAEPAEKGGTDAQTAATKSLYAQADAAQKLLDRYTALGGVSVKTAAQQAEQSRIVNQLQAAISAGVAVVDKDTQAVTLNTVAVQQSIDKKREAFANQKQSFVDQLSYVDSGISDIEANIVKLQGAVSKGAITLSQSGIGAGRVQEIREALKEQDALRAKFGVNVTAQATQGFSATELRAVESAINAEKQLAAAEANLKAQQAERAKIAANLTAVSKLGVAATKDHTAALLPDIDADKKKKQSVADVAKAEYELQKQRLQARITDLDRQADNPANSESIRTAAVAKAVATRGELAKLERNEGVREAAQANKDKINGDQATATARVRLSEAFENDLVKITREGDAKQLALRNLVLAQLAEVDKLVLEDEITSAEKVRDDVNKTYDERQKAAREVAHAQIELAALVRDAEIRAAQGALDKIVLANKKYEQARQQASASVPVYDSKKAIDEQDISYARLLLGTETLHSKQLTSEKEYLRQVRDLENRREAEAIASLKAQYGETAEVLTREAALEKKLREQGVEDTKKAEQRKAEIIQASLDAVQGLADGYFDFQSAQLDAQAQNEQASYDNSIKAAGDNAALKTQIEADHAKRLAKIQHDQAVNERNAALFSIAISTAVAVAKSLKDFGLPLAIPFIAADLIIGGLQVAAVLSKPIPNYFVGRKDGPAEFANLAERGPELVGKPGSFRLFTQPTVGYLQAGDKVIPAPETRQILAQNQLVEGRLLYRREQFDMEQQATRLRVGSAQQQQAQQRAMQQSNAEVVAGLRRVERAIHEQAYQRFNENDDLVTDVTQPQ